MTMIITLPDGHEPFSVIFARLSRDLGSDDASNRRQFACDTNIQRLHIRPSHTNPVFRP